MKSTRTKLLILFTGAILILSFNSIPEKNNPFQIPKGFVLVPSATYYFNLDTTQSKKIELSSFLVAEAELTNKEYNEFLLDLIKSGKTEDYKICMPDTFNWKSGEYDLPMYAGFYHNSKATENFPVVNICFEAANIYCDWLTQKMRKEGLIAQNQRFRLPTKEEWEYLAFFGPRNQSIPYIFSLKDKDDKQNCNYRKVDQESIFYNSETQKAEVQNTDTKNLLGIPPQPMAVKTFKSNDFGLYDIYGNVAEMISIKSFACGGSFNSYGGDIVNNKMLQYKKSSCEVGIRLVIANL